MTVSNTVGRGASRSTMSVEVVGEHRLVGAVVVAEHHHGDVPAGIEAVVEDAIAEVDEATALGIDLDLPTARHELACTSHRRSDATSTP